MNAQERQARFDLCSDEFCGNVWEAVEEDEGRIIFGCAVEAEVVSLNLSMDGFVDDDEKFSLEVWEEQMKYTLDNSSVWFTGIAFPFSSSSTGNFIAVVTLDAFTAYFSKIVFYEKSGRRKKRYASWEALDPFPLLMDLIVVLRNKVTPQG